MLTTICFHALRVKSVGRRFTGYSLGKQSRIYKLSFDISLRTRLSVSLLPDLDLTVPEYFIQFTL